MSVSNVQMSQQTQPAKRVEEKKHKTKNTVGCVFEEKNENNKAIEEITRNNIRGAKIGAVVGGIVGAFLKGNEDVEKVIDIPVKKAFFKPIKVLGGENGICKVIKPIGEEKAARIASVMGSKLDPTINKISDAFAKGNKTVGNFVNKIVGKTAVETASETIGKTIGKTVGETAVETVSKIVGETVCEKKAPIENAAFKVLNSIGKPIGAKGSARIARFIGLCVGKIPFMIGCAAVMAGIGAGIGGAIVQRRTSNDTIKEEYKDVIENEKYYLNYSS